MKYPSICTQICKPFTPFWWARPFCPGCKKCDAHDTENTFVFDIQHVSICKFTSDIRAAETYGKLVRIQYSRTTTLAADSSKDAPAHAESNGIQRKSDRSTAMQLPSQKAAQTRSPLTHGKTNHRKVSERHQMSAASPIANYRPALSTCAAPKVCVCAAQFVTYCQRWHPLDTYTRTYTWKRWRRRPKGLGTATTLAYKSSVSPFRSLTLPHWRVSAHA